MSHFNHRPDRFNLRVLDIAGKEHVAAVADQDTFSM